MFRSISVVLFLLLGSAAGAKADGPSFPSILNVTENAAGTAITINGSNFGSKTPEVTLSGAELTVTASNETSITAALPASLPAGAYLLTVAVRDRDGRDSDPRHVALFVVTIGQVGPTGPQGPQGVQGPMGATGPQGPGSGGADWADRRYGRAGAAGTGRSGGADWANGRHGCAGTGGATRPDWCAGATRSAGASRACRHQFQFNAYLCRCNYGTD